MGTPRRPAPTGRSPTLNTRLDGQAHRLLEVDEQIPPSLLRRFFDRLRNQDEKVLLAIIKFYLDASRVSEDTLDKLDILFTRLAEIPREDHGSLMRERHEIERLVQPLLQYRPAPQRPPTRRWRSSSTPSPT